MKLDELKTLLALNGSKRLPHYEAEIFANRELTALYLQTLVTDSLSDHDTRWSNACHVYYYARDVMQSRWPAAEHILHSDWWTDYRYEFGIDE